jgi:short-subunit dehydrogenase
MHKKILIVGGSSGLGKRLAEMYTAEGCVIGIIARRESLLKEIQSASPSQIHIAAADINTADIESKLTSLIELMGGIDVCIITASVVEFNHELSITPELKTIETNVAGFTKILNTVWHYFKQKGTGQIAVTTSIAAARGNKIAPAYHASKAFQSMYLESIRVKNNYEKNNIIITELVPGYMDTAMGKGDRLFWMAPLDKAANQVKKAIEKKKKRAFITKRWWLIYQVYRFMPSFIYNRIVNSSISLQKK